MIQSAKDLFIPNYNMISTRKETKNSVSFEEFASVLKTEDSRLVTKTPPVDAEKPVFIDNPISPERKIGVKSENFSSDLIEESIPVVENVIEKEKENAGLNDDNLLYVALQMAAPFAIVENLENDSINNPEVELKSDLTNSDLINTDLTNSQEYEINDASYSNIMTEDEVFPIPLSPDEEFYENVSDSSALYAPPATKERISVDRDLPFTQNDRNVEIDDKSALVNTNALLNMDDKTDHKEVVLHESFILGYEEDEEVSLNIPKSDNPDKPFTINEKNDIDISEEPDNPAYADINQKMVKVPGKRDQKLNTKPNEKAPQSSALNEQENTMEKITEPVKTPDTEKNNAPKTINFENDVPGFNDDELSNNDKFDVKNKNNLNKEVNVSTENEFDKPTAENRLEFQDFTHRINEQRSLLSNDATKSLADSQQMNLINRGRPAFTESIANVVRFVRLGENTKAVLIVDPPDLGRVNIELASTDNGIEAVLRVSNEQIKMLVQENAAQLKQSLSEIGVNLSEFTVDIQQDDSRSREQYFNYQGKKKRTRFGDAEDESKPESIETFRVDLRKGLLHWVA